MSASQHEVSNKRNGERTVPPSFCRGDLGEVCNRGQVRTVPIAAVQLNYSYVKVLINIFGEKKIQTIYYLIAW